MFNEGCKVLQKLTCIAAFGFAGATQAGIEVEQLSAERWLEVLQLQINDPTKAESIREALRDPANMAAFNVALEEVRQRAAEQYNQRRAYELRAASAGKLPPVSK